MEKKIIELTKCGDGHRCIICCEQDATTLFNIQRLINLKNDQLLMFYICDNCLSKAQQDIHKICE